MAAPETTASILADLNDLIGLQPVKDALARLAAVHQLNAKRAAAGEPVIAQPLDLVFAGEPGTGEDEVARIVARLYVSLGLLPEVKVAEVSRPELVAATAEETVARVEAAIQVALGGVLFVDEAQLLIPTTAEDHGDVAITALVAAMEARAGQLAVILAGPTDALRLIVEHHPGLNAAFEELITFPRYTPEELVALFEQKAAALKIKVPTNVLAAVSEHLVEVHADGSFRSARYIPSLLEEMYARMATRTTGASPAELKRGFAVEDVPQPAAATLGDTGVKVGFTAGFEAH